MGPIANLSDDLWVLCDFLGRARAQSDMQMGHQSEELTGSESAYFLVSEVSHFGHLASLM